MNDLRIRNTDDLLTELNILNSCYCDLSEQFFGQRIGANVDYDQYLSAITKLLRIASDCEITIREIKNNNTNLPDCVSHYLDSRKESIFLFQAIVEKLKRKVNGKRYGLFEYRKDMKLWSEAEEKSVCLGDPLQSFSEHFYQSDEGRRQLFESRKALMNQIRAFEQHPNK